MVKKSKKSKSKRVPLRKKYKILRKVKEHHKKKAKEAKKLGKKKKPVEKDPGIPNAWPFKEQELQALEARRARALEEMELKKQAKKERAQKRKLGLLEEGDGDLAGFVDTVHNRTSQFEDRKRSAKEASNKSVIKDGSQRAFYKELLKVIEASDVILEVLDARDPLGSRCKDVERLVLKSGPAKNLVLLVNKIDLIPREVAEKWLKYLREELPTVAFKCSTQQQKAHLGQKRSIKGGHDASNVSTNECLGADTLLQLLKNYSRNHKIKTAITVGVIGLPNVGKSSLINSMKRARAVNVGATPGVTRVLQEVQLDKNVKLLDCPGVVVSKASENQEAAVLRNSIKIEKLEDPSGPVKEILRLCPAERLMSVYKIPSFQSPDEFLQQVASVRGKLKKGGLLDLMVAARIVLKDWNEGKIPFYTLPPARPQDDHVEAAIVAEWSKEFSVEEVYKNEDSTVISSLRSLVESAHMELPASAPVAMEIPDFKLDNEEDDDKIGDADEDEDEDAQANGVASTTDMDTSEVVVMKGGKGPEKGQNEKLYDVEGIQNPHVVRAERKRRKKAFKSTSKDADADDYDFSVDYKETHAMES